MDAKIAKRQDDYQYLGFNPRARDGRERLPRSTKTCLVGFNPRARDGREVLRSIILGAAAVSIHAPVMDAKAPSLSR